MKPKVKYAGAFQEWRDEDYRFMEYEDYLLTDRWKTIRRLKLESAGGRCQVCDSEVAVEVHHRTYARRGQEQLADLTVLCSDCHARYHDKLPNPRLGDTGRAMIRDMKAEFRERCHELWERYANIDDADDVMVAALKRERVRQDFMAGKYDI